MDLGYAATVDRFSEGLARVCGIYGMNPLYGRLYGALFLSPTPLTLEELTARVGAAKSTVSVGVRKLVDARAVRRSWRKADRRDWYEATTDPHQLLRDLVDRYVRPELALWTTMGKEAAEALAEASGEDWPPEGERAELERRLQALDGFVSAWEPALAAMEVTPAGTVRRIAIEFEP